jgi:hypothetical protein
VSTVDPLVTMLALESNSQLLKRNPVAVMTGSGAEPMTHPVAASSPHVIGPATPAFCKSTCQSGASMLKI